jgi:hypothetical protein
VFARDGERPAPGGTGGEALKVRTGKCVSSKPLTQTSQEPLQAELCRSDTCSSAGLVGRGAAPILSLCREMIAAGMSPDNALEVFRGSVLAVRVRSIGEAAVLEINSKGTGFVRTGPPMRSNGLGRT